MGLFGIGSKAKKHDLMEEDLPRRGLFAFFDIYFGRFMKFIGVNFLMLGAFVPYMALLFFISPLNAAAVGIVQGEAMWVHIDVLLRILFALFVVLFWGAGPMGAGISYIFRCYASREHAWIMTDFKDKMIENLWQSLIIMVVDIVVILIAPYILRFYSAQYAQKGSVIFLVIVGVVIVLLTVYTFMHYFMYQMMVRYECKLKDIYKNAYLLTIVKFPVLVIVTAICLALFAVPVYFLDVYSIMIFAIILMSLIRFILEFYASRVIEDAVEPEESKEKAIDPDRKWHK